MIRHSDVEDRMVRKMIRSGEIKLAGNSTLYIYGTLRCKSGKKLKRMNRVFFHNLSDAISNGYRPCGHCMRSEYKKWKNEIV